MTAYLFATVDVDDADGYENYKSTAPALIEKHGGRYIVRGGANDVVEGTWPSGRIVVLEFPDFASANAFADDPDYAPIAAIRHATATSHVWIVEGPEGDANADGKHAYILGSIRMTDPEGYKPYADQVPAVMNAAQGTYLARGGKSRSVEGGMELDRLVIVAFADMAAARAFYDGDGYTEIKPIRIAASDSNIVIVEGL
ncbi:MAG: DUF1330 domain-containing protein [Rhodospirillaceae bacterium]|nr:DUF1330 domain-containing protein [Rhodospirillaceae bacterium]